VTRGGSLRAFLVGAGGISLALPVLDAIQARHADRGVGKRRPTVR